MSKPLPFTEDEMKQVFDTNLIEYAISQGFDVEKADKHSYHVKKSGGLYLFPKGYHHFTETDSGNIIDFAKKYQGLTFIKAVETILGTTAYSSTLPPLPTKSSKKHNDMVLPQKSDDVSQTLHYLVNERCLDEDIVKDLIRQGTIFTAITKSKGTEYMNCAFVSYDSNNKPKYCSLRGLGKSSFRQDVENSDKSYGFMMKGTSNRVFLFESPIDAISHASISKMNKLDYTADFRVSEGCLSDKALARFLAENTHITDIVFCFDNDKDGKGYKGKPKNHGQEYARKCVKKYAELGYSTYIQTPQNKDFNADLQYVKKSVLKKLNDIKSKIPKAERHEDIQTTIKKTEVL